MTTQQVRSVQITLTNCETLEFLSDAVEGEFMRVTNGLWGISVYKTWGENFNERFYPWNVISRVMVSGVVAENEAHPVPVVP